MGFVRLFQRRLQLPPAAAAQADIVVRVYGASAVFSAASWLGSQLHGDPPAGVAGMALGTCCLVASLAAMYGIRGVPRWLLEVDVLVLSAATLMADLAAAAAPRWRTWPWVVLIMDFAVLVNVRPAVTFAVLLCTVTWLGVTAIEDHFRLGLYDHFLAAGGNETDGCCGNPPCPQPVIPSVFKWGASSFILLVDFYATRRFAEGQRRQRSHVQASVDVTQRITSALALFDLAQAEEVLAEAELPAELRDTLATLLSNLASYRPYLPQSCLPDGEGQAATPLPCLDSTSSDTIAVVSAHAASPGAESILPDSTSVASSRGVRPTRPVQKSPQVLRAALLLTNLHGFLCTVQRMDLADISAGLNEEICNFVACVSLRSGVADSLSGDHFSASFGAAKHCRRQLESAVECAWSLGDTGVSMPASRSTSVCAGRAVAGDFGTVTMQRHMIFGRVSSLVNVAERLATKWNLYVLVDQKMHDDVCHEWVCRLRRPVVVEDISSKPFHFWEILRRCERVRGNDDGPQEWMYELGSREPNPWAAFNAVMKRWSESGADAVVGLTVDNGVGEGGGGPEAAAVDQALRRLKQFAQLGGPPALVIRSPAHGDDMCTVFGEELARNTSVAEM